MVFQVGWTISPFCRHREVGRQPLPSFEKLLNHMYLKYRGNRERQINIQVWYSGPSSAAILAMWQKKSRISDGVKGAAEASVNNSTSRPCLCSSLSSLAQPQRYYMLVWERGREGKKEREMQSHPLVSTVTCQKWVTASLQTAEPAELQSQGSGNRLICWCTCQMLQVPPETAGNLVGFPDRFTFK